MNCVHDINYNLVRVNAHLEKGLKFRENLQRRPLKDFTNKDAFYTFIYLLLVLLTYTTVKF